MSVDLTRQTYCANRLLAMFERQSVCFARFRQERMPESIQIEIYSRPGCHLCEEAKAVIEPFSRRYPLEIRVTDVDSSPNLRTQYGTEIPVILINGTEAFRHRVDAKSLERKLKETWNRSTS
jgi:glutaredoxin